MLPVFFGCNDTDEGPRTSQNNDSTQKAKAYFPVIDFIKSEIRFVDSLPVGIMKYTTENNITDSGYIELAEFHRLAQEFLHADLTREAFENNYSETSFFDNTTQYASFLYLSNKKNVKVNRVDVLARPEDVVYNKVNSIYMEKNIENRDSSTTQKLYWKAGKNFQINTEIRKPNQEAITRQVKVVWNTWN
jgi:hypothetical protein